MINSRFQPQIKEDTLETMARLYPLAFAMAVASNSHAGLALRRYEIAVLNSRRQCVDWSLNALPVIKAGLPLAILPLI